MTQPEFDKTFDALTRPLDTGVDERQIRMEEAAQNKQVRAIVEEGDKTGYLDWFASINAMGEYGLDPWDIDAVGKIIAAEQEAQGLQPTSASANAHANVFQAALLKAMCKDGLAQRIARRPHELLTRQRLQVGRLMRIHNATYFEIMAALEYVAENQDDEERNGE